MGIMENGLVEKFLMLQYGTAITSCFIDSPNKDFIRRLGYIYKTTLNGIEYYEATKESTVFIKK